MDLFCVLLNHALSAWCKQSNIVQILLTGWFLSEMIGILSVMAYITTEYKFFVLFHFV